VESGGEAIFPSIPFHCIEATFFIEGSVLQIPGWFFSRMPRRAPELLDGQIGRIADLHAQHPKGEVHGCTE